MKLSYDPKANAAYICFREKQGDIEPIELTADSASTSTKPARVCRIELLNANEQLTAGDDGKLVFVNQVNGAHGEMKVA